MINKEFGKWLVIKNPIKKNGKKMIHRGIEIMLKKNEIGYHVKIKIIVRWLIYKELTDTDNKHIKKMCKVRDLLLQKTNYDKQDLVEFCIYDLDKLDYVKNKLRKDETPFAYIATILYKTLFPSLLKGYEIAEKECGWKKEKE